MLPVDFAATLRAMHRRSDPLLSATLRAAWTRGWLQGELGDALGVSRQAISLRIIRTPEPTDLGALPSIPDPPPPPPPPPPKPAKPTIDAPTAERLRRMHAVAKTVNGATPADHPTREVSIAFTAELAALRCGGISGYRIAKTLGVTTGAVHLRLGRHGYGELPPSMRKHRYRGRKTGDPR